QARTRVIPRHRLSGARARLGEIAPAGPHNVPARRVENKATLASLRQAKPAFVTRPRNRAALSQTIRNSRQGLRPPHRFANYPRPPSPGRVTELGKHTPSSHSDSKWKRTPEQRTPQFIAGVAMMIPQFAAHLLGVVVTDGDNR